jgi:hypothetical protein
MKKITRVFLSAVQIEEVSGRQIRLGEVRDQTAAVPQTAVGTVPRGDLLVEREQMGERDGRSRRPSRS